MSPSVSFPLKPVPFPALCGGPVDGRRSSSHPGLKPCQPLAIISSAAALGSEHLAKLLARRRAEYGVSALPFPMPFRCSTTAEACSASRTVESSSTGVRSSRALLIGVGGLRGGIEGGAGGNKGGTSRGAGEASPTVTGVTSDALWRHLWVRTAPAEGARHTASTAIPMASGVAPTAIKSRTSAAMATRLTGTRTPPRRTGDTKASRRPPYGHRRAWSSGLDQA